MKTYLMRRTAAFALLLTIAAAVPAPNRIQAAWTPDHRVPEERGAAGLGQALKRLGTIASALHTGAHPDDEDSGLLAYLARGRQARTAYLSLTRGDGGQNLIGPEIYEALGVIRTEELLAARRIDGAQQFFTRAYDFGFSKTPEETLSKWDREAVLSDMVRVIRTFRPLVIVSAWTGTSLDGHGHHQASGILTADAYRAAADPARFPEQIKEGLAPWQARKLYVRAPAREELPRGQEPPPATLSINKGQFDPLLGRTYFEIAMQGRSQHRSQDQGAIERPGPQYSKLRLVESTVGRLVQEKDIFENLDVRLTAIGGFAPGSAAEMRPFLAAAQQSAEEALAKFNPLAPALVAPIIAKGLKAIRSLRRSIEPLDPASATPHQVQMARPGDLKPIRLDGAQRYDVEFLLKQKEADFADALARSMDVVVDCLADEETVTPGQSFTVSIQAYGDSGAVFHSAALRVPGWTSEQQKETSSTTDGRLAASVDFKLTVARDAKPSDPYWLEEPRKGDMFSIRSGGTGIEPNAPPVAAGAAVFEIAGEEVTVERKVQFRFADKALGEIRRDLKVVPAVSVAISPDLLVYPEAGASLTRDLTVTITNNRKGPARGTVALDSDAGWKANPHEAAFDLRRKGEQQSLTVSVTREGATHEGSLSAYARLDDGSDYRYGYQRLSYPHIESRLLARRAQASAVPIDVKVAPGLKVGYIEGAGDDFANALKRMDVDVHFIDPREVASGDLSKYDTIVTGVRVYEVRPDVIANNARLLDYVKNGGTLIVQYNKNEIAEGNFTPYPVKMKRGMPDRVTDETAAVRILDPSSPLFTYPNKVSEADFAGWIQERGAYFFSEWDPQYKALLACHDPGEEDKQGGELIARVGKGYYVYSAYAWFRQLPLGVPGAYRLIANMVSLPKAGPVHSARR